MLDKVRLRFDYGTRSVVEVNLETKKKVEVNVRERGRRGKIRERFSYSGNGDVLEQAQRLMIYVQQPSPRSQGERVLDLTRHLRNDQLMTSEERNRRLLNSIYTTGQSADSYNINTR